MSNQKNSEKSAAKASMSLDQLSDTIEVMTSMVTRLKHHLDLQLTQPSTEEKAKTLSNALLSNERDLQELQALAKLQRQSIEAQTLPAVHSTAEEAAGQDYNADDHDFVIE